ncbi:AAA family ATPase [Nitrosomonas marina]|uniref:Wobble nucleotide-excising tRNase n=1 Tax=Nitrosomonas marina TaxID=917 RepID=A0A1H8GS01_9PROT|nr:AAA family ATPase [Nitrosomonas marina]SEN46625.1 Wobble nucleotide-excising tRNase [Nitrosomonas marina]
MLERIYRVKGIGLLHDADGRPHSLKKATLVYADNGVGKSTLASIFRSCASNDPELIRRRKTIDGNCPPEVLLQFSNGQQSSFAKENWNNSHPELLVFDADFVEKNVYAGGQVSTDQRKNLLQFALGSSAVNAQREYDQADTAALAASQLVRDLTNQLTGFHQGVSLQQFRDLAEVSDADNQIAALHELAVEAQNIGLIQAKALPKKLDEPAFDVTHIFRILESSLADIDLAAEQRVKQHLDSHAKPNLERWISDGHAYGETESCPYCNQPLQGVELIQAYRSYFNKDYNELKASVADLARLISNVAPEAIVERLQASFATASATIDGWQEHVEIPPPEFDCEAANEKLAVIRERLEALRLAKEANLLETVGSDDAKNELLGIWSEIAGIIKSCNDGIDNAVNLITAYKASLAAVNLDGLRQAINGLEMAKTRHRQDVLDLFSQLDAALAQEVATKAEKQTKKDALNGIMQTTLERYKGRINRLLSAFGAQFSIPNIDFNYKGGLRSNYNLHMRGANIELTGGIPDFKTSLSESDKRTLAFAFFVASVESDADLANRVVVIDDPMCSLDLNRKQQTRLILKRVHDACEQLIVLVHDIHFMRGLRNEILRTSPPQEIACVKLKTVANRYSNFDEIDIDKECESAYFKCHRVLGEYLNGAAQSSMEVARSIRPMLEGYLHRRFPGLINGGLLFGQVIDAIKNAPQGSPLIHAQNITDELTGINSYAGQFHHDTNPSADQVQIIDGELRQFVERAINVVHAGMA